MRAGLLLFLVVLAIGGCQFPRDVEGTLERVDGGTLRVGASEHEPFVTLDQQQPGGVEARLVEDFARGLGARVQYVRGGEEDLVERLREGELDLVIGGITKKSPFKKEVAPTRPYAVTRDRIADKPVTNHHVMFVRNGENAFLVRLERYLLNRKAQIRRIVAEEEAKP